MPDACYVHAYGIITNPFTEIETLRELHGVKKNEHFCIWVDRVRIEKMSDTLYLAKFDKWEKSGEVSVRQDCRDPWLIYIIIIIIVQQLLHRVHLVISKIDVVVSSRSPQFFSLASEIIDLARVPFEKFEFTKMIALNAILKFSIISDYEPFPMIQAGTTPVQLLVLFYNQK